MERGETENRRAAPGLLLDEITRGEAARRAPHALAVLPVGATEQHGPHLPLGTDRIIVEQVARAAAAAAAGEVDLLVAPVLPFGSSHHHLPFGGTISLSTERYYWMLREMVESLIVDGFRRVFILNGHGGNHEIVQLVARDLALAHPVNVAAASYWDLARPILTAEEPALEGRFPGHAGYFETSLLLALRPELVRTPLPRRTEEEMARMVVPSAPYRAERHGFWGQIDGHTDSPHEATAEVGERLLGRIVPAVAAAFVEFAAMPLS